MATIATMDAVLKAVLSQGNQEQNQCYPPHIFDAHFNLVTEYLLDETAKVFSITQVVKDIARPFLVTKGVRVVNGLITLPEDLRNLLGIAIYTTKDFTDHCSGESSSEEEEMSETCDLPDDPLAPSVLQIKKNIQRGTCSSQAVNIVDQDEWDDLTKHKYKYPTLKKPIGCMFLSEGIKICPIDVPNVDVRYIKTPKIYEYGYKLNPDDTYVYDPSTSVESEWTKNSFNHLVSGITALYSVYAKDGEMRDALAVLKKSITF